MIPADFISQLKVLYPKRDGGQVWPAVSRLIPCYVQPDEWDRVVQGTKNYAVYCQRKGQLGTDFVMMARTFYGRDRHWEEYADMDVRTPAQVAADAKLATLQARANALGVQVAGMDSRAAEEAIVQAERAALNRKWEQQGMNQPKFQVVRNG